MRGIKVKIPRSAGDSERLELVWEKQEIIQPPCEDDDAADVSDEEEEEEGREPEDRSTEEEDECCERHYPSFCHSDSTAETDNRTGSLIGSISRSYSDNVPVDFVEQECEITKVESALSNNNEGHNTEEDQAADATDTQQLINLESAHSNNDDGHNSAEAAVTDTQQFDTLICVEEADGAEGKEQQLLEPAKSSSSSASSVGRKATTAFTDANKSEEPNKEMSINGSNNNPSAGSDTSRRNNKIDEADAVDDMDRVVSLREYEGKEKNSSDEEASYAVLSSIDIARQPQSPSLISEVTPYSGSFFVNDITGGRSSYPTHLQRLPNAASPGYSSDDDASAIALDGYIDSKPSSKPSSKPNSLITKLFSRKKKGTMTQDMHDKKKGSKNATFLPGPLKKRQRQGHNIDSKRNAQKKPVSKQRVWKQERVEKEPPPPLVDVFARKRNVQNPAHKNEHSLDAHSPPLVDVFARMRTPSFQSEEKPKTSPRVLAELRGNGLNVSNVPVPSGVNFKAQGSGRTTVQWWTRSNDEEEEEERDSKYLSFAFRFPPEEVEETSRREGLLAFLWKLRSCAIG